MANTKVFYRGWTLCTLMICLAALPAVGIAAWELNDEFGDSGVVITPLSVFDDGIEDITLFDDGRILAVGFSDTGSYRNAAMVRYNTDGSVDPSFVFNYGIDFAVGDNALHDLTIQSDGASLVAGFATQGRRKVGMLIRVLENGELDQAFATDGITEYSEDGADVVFNSVIELTANLFVAAGSLSEGDRTYPILVAFDSSGSLFTEFGEQGVIVENEMSGTISSLVTQAGFGRLVAAGTYTDTDERDGVLLLGYNYLGARSAGFGSAGVVRYINQEEEIFVSDCVVGEEEKIVIAGRVWGSGGGRRMMMGRYLANGVADDGFGSNGIVVYDNGIDGGLNAVAMRVDGSLVAAGFQNGESDREGAYLVPDNDDEVDIITTQISDSDDTFATIAVASDDSVFTAGSSVYNGDGSFLVANFIDAPDPETKPKPKPKPKPDNDPDYTIQTAPLADISRVGAMTGGAIVALDADAGQCISECEAQCSGTEEEIAACKDECPAGCEIPSVTKRGVVFSIDPEPKYQVADSTDPAADNDNTSGIGDFWDYEAYRVTGGQTEDGSGVGDFTSEIDGVNPQTSYYVRSYALLSDDTVIYGNERRFETNDACFIATAAFGSERSMEVRLLRRFRDVFLAPHDWGRHLIGWYYHYSPHLAATIEANVLLRLAAALCLLPITAMVFLLLNPLVAVQMLAAFAGIYWCKGNFYPRSRYE